MVKKPIHPGEHLRREVLEPRGLTVTDAANQLGITRQTLNNILNGKSGISPKMAVRLARFFGMRPETVQQWQKEYELGQARSGRSPLTRARGDTLSVSSNDLVAWADTIDARYALPKLVRALVRATTDSGSTIHFPAMEDAQGPGWDGVVMENSKKSAYVPRGTSAWELSTETNPQAKAESDYQKRTQNALGLTPINTTLVVVTLRRFRQKRQWAADKNQEGIWAKVFAYDATDLEQWLELAPEVAIWLAARLGRWSPGVQSLETFWNEFSVSTAPPIGPPLLLAGRSSEADKVAEWLESGAGVLRVLADSTDEALAFMAAVSATRALPGNLLTNTIVVEDAEQARQLMTTSHQLTFGWRLDDPSLLGTIIDKGHRAFVPVSRSTAGAQHADLELPRLGRGEFVAAIKDTLDDHDDPKKEEEANRRARISGRSITVYRRLYASAGVSQAPRWATPEHAGELIPVLLAGSWSESNEGDQSALSTLAGCDYLSISRLLVRCKNQPDCPVRQIGDTWTLVAPLDAWSLLAKFITDVEFDRYRKVVLEVLGESDPALQLEPSERWLAKLHNKDFKYSDSLRRGLAESLVLLAVVGNEVGLQISRSAANPFENLVTELIGRGPDAKRWASISDQLPLIAEAAPEAFLFALEDSLTAKNPDVMTLFEVEERPLGGGARHPHLLWALEVLAWFPEHLPRSARILAKLSRLDPGGNLSNRPMASLRAIFCCWHPNTAAALDVRLQAIDSLLEREPDVAWKLLLDLLPKSHDVGDTSAEPRWRAMPERNSITWGEIWRANEGVISRTLEQAALRCDRLCQIVDRINTWSPEQCARFVQQLQSFAQVCDIAEQRTALWREIRGFVSHSRTYLSFAEADLDPFDRLLESLEPVDILERHKWLFDDDLPALTHPKRPYAEGKMEIEGRIEEVALARREALTLIMRDQSVYGLLALAKRVKLPNHVGTAAAETVAESVELEILERTLSGEDPKIRQAGLVFAWRRNQINGPNWFENVLRSDSFKGWPAAMQADFCLTLPEGRATWKVVSSLGLAVEERYWRESSVFLIRLNQDDDAEFAINKLLEAGRELDALDQAGSAPERLSTGILIRVLESTIGVLAKAKNLHRGMLDHDIEMILRRLRGSGELSAGELGRLEFQYLPLLQPLHRPVTLYKSLQSDAKFFADVVGYAFKPDEEDSGTTHPIERTESEEIDRNRARLAWGLLSQWDAVPGLQQDGTLDVDLLNDWFRMARLATTAKKRLRIGDVQIGQVLAHAPTGTDGIWPHEGVRNLIEETESRDLESGLRAGRINQRGVWTRSPFEGGRPERELAKRYRTDAKTLVTRWQRTARLINSLADTYETFGRHDDITAEALDF